MTRFLPLLLLLLCAGAYGQQSRFTQALLDQDGRLLHIRRADGSQSAAPRLDGQEAFDAPAVAGNRQYVGWLALFPDQGASYSQPLDLVVMDRSNRLHRFRGDFGMVFGWCFSRTGTAVVFRSAFPHGPTPVAFEMRRISDGKLLRRLEFPEHRSPDGEEATPDPPLPSWAKCAASSDASD